jgi:hypothetical protein
MKLLIRNILHHSVTLKQDMTGQLGARGIFWESYIVKLNSLYFTNCHDIRKTLIKLMYNNLTCANLFFVNANKGKEERIDEILAKLRDHYCTKVGKHCTDRGSHPYKAESETAVLSYLPFQIREGKTRHSEHSCRISIIQSVLCSE